MRFNAVSVADGVWNDTFQTPRKAQSAWGMGHGTQRVIHSTYTSPFKWHNRVLY